MGRVGVVDLAAELFDPSEIVLDAPAGDLPPLVNVRDATVSGGRLTMDGEDFRGWPPPEPADCAARPG